jgi:hypothetical protein
LELGLGRSEREMERERAVVVRQITEEVDFDGSDLKWWVVCLRSLV